MPDVDINPLHPGPNWIVQVRDGAFFTIVSRFTLPLQLGLMPLFYHPQMWL